MRTEHVLRCSLEHHLAPQPSGLGTHVDHIVGCQHHVLVMLYHNDRVAQVTQLLQGMNQTQVITLVQSDTWFIENVENVDQLRADLRGQPDALALPARETDRRTIQREIVEPHIQKELQARTDFLQDFLRYPLLLVIEIFRHV